MNRTKASSLSLNRKDLVTIVVSVVAAGASGILERAGSELPLFVASAVALAALAALIGIAIDHLSDRLAPSVTGILQSALGNLPELFICVFALQAGLISVVQTALIGSILANSLLVLGLAFFAGGIVNGRQRFSTEAPRMIGIVIAVAVAALMMPSLAVLLHSPAEPHTAEVSIVCAIVLLAIFAGSVVFAMRIKEVEAEYGEEEAGTKWPLWFTIVVLGCASAAAAFVSDWFVDSLKPTIALLGLSEAFTGLVVVAIAGNAVENVVGVTMAVRNRPALAISLILNSSLQVAVFLIPALVLLSFFLPGPHLTLVFPPLLVVALIIGAAIPMLAVYDGESNWVEGLALIGLYAMIAAAFWWG